MKRKGTKLTIKYPEEKKPRPVQKKPDTKPLAQDYVKFVKCIYNGPVNVKNAPSGKKYSFQPGQTRPVRDQRDFHHLMSLKRDPGPGCCSGSPYEPRLYFDVVDFDKEN